MDMVNAESVNNSFPNESHKESSRHADFTNTVTEAAINKWHDTIRNNAADYQEPRELLELMRRVFSVHGENVGYVMDLNQLIARSAAQFFCQLASEKPHIPM